jgi:hypothetical protein
VEKIRVQVTDDNMAHAHCMMDTKGYKQTLKICNTYWFSTATMVAQTRPSVTLYVHRLPCSYNQQQLLPQSQSH